MVIDLDCMKHAINKVHEAEQDMLRTFAVVDERMDLLPYRELRGLLQRDGELVKNRIFSVLGGKFNYNEINQALQVILLQDDVMVEMGAKGTIIKLKRGE